ncbi:PAS domain S-box protein [Gracilimonas mengyeensis]|uniref:PAS domain S-box-containing protein n=1 Tax=Gracilimonas mengyeensis TaxID=1302730 RepID=A0A521AM63_9BACT|nr:PAS domain S-box protein [Gracilimonas mengyeensis]SMO35918.1 PAS domain S-box-containing protein [Gracilimonas mengyeensis]
MYQTQLNLKVLVVEDNPGDFVLIEEYLSENFKDPETTHVTTFSQAEKELSSNHNFNVILLDLTLPDAKGEELVKKMTSISESIPIIVLTGYENQEFGLRTLSMGIADYLLKDEITPFILGKVIAYSIERNRIGRSLKESEKKYRDIFNLSPQPMWVFEIESLRFLDVNQAAIDHYGYSREEFLSMTIRDLNANPSPDLNSAQVVREDQKELTVTHKKKDGSEIQVRIKADIIDYLGDKAKIELAEDVTQKLKTEHSLAQKSQLLSANAKVASALIKNENWLNVLSETFQIIGEAIEVDRVYYFENHEDPETGQKMTSQKIEWTTDSATPQLDNPELQNLNQTDFKELYDLLRKGKIFKSLVKDLPDSLLKEALEAQDILSILIFPIFVKDEFYGYIGFDDCQTERQWNKEEIQYLRTISSNISSTIQLRNTTRELQMSEYKFKSMVEEGGDLIEILDKHGGFNFISPNLTKILGWQYDEIKDKTMFDFIHPDELEAAKQDFEELRSSKYVNLRSFRFQHKDGKYKWLKCTGSNLADDPIISGFLITASDITQQKYYSELQRLERDVLEKNALQERNVRDIIKEFLLGIEHLHTGIRTSVTLAEGNQLRCFATPSFPASFMEELDGIPIAENSGSCGTAAYRGEPVIVENIFESPLWEGFTDFGEKYNFIGSWSQPVFNNRGELIASFAVYYEKPAFPTQYEHNTVERAAHILRILFESEEKVQAEQKLALREKRFKALVQEGSDLIAILDEDFRFSYISPTSGENFEEYLHMPAVDFIHPEDQAKVKEKIRTLAHEKRIVLDPYRLQAKDGRYHWVETIITNLMDEPAVGGYVANSRNITGQIKREEKLYELSLVASKTTEMVVISDNQSRVTWVNSAFEKTTGFELEDIKGIRPGDILQGRNTDLEVSKRLRKAQANYESIEDTNLYYKKNGEPFWLNLSIDPILNEDGECTHIISILKDVTEKIEKSKELQSSLERYDAVNKATSEAIWDLDLESDLMVYNDNFRSIFGYNQTQIENVGSWWRDKIHPEDLGKVDEALADVLKNNKKERFQIEYRYKASDGSYKHVFDRAYVLKDDKGKAVRMIGAMQDVTHEVQEQERLKLLESVITNTSESVTILQAEPGKFGREIVYANEAFTKLTGYSKDEVIGRTLHFLNGPETDDEVREQLRTAMKNFTPVEVEFINYKKDGTPFWVNTSMVPVADNNGNYTHWVAIGRDVTDQKNYEAEIKASLSEKETLLAEIHHRVKNNLAVVSGMMQLQAFDSTNEDLKAKLYDSVVRIKTMATVHELLYNSNSFSQLDFSDTLVKLVENVSETLQTGSKVDLKIECDPIKLNINQAIPASLIVNEVITNSFKHAFKDRKDGTLVFELKEKPNDKILISITDNGVGLPEDEEYSNQSSLGLHLIEVLAQQIEAEYSYENVQPGTQFTICFERQIQKSGIGSNSMEF